MLQDFVTEYKENEFGFPLGGTARAIGIEIAFQPGPIKDKDIQTGAFVETLIAIAAHRLQYYQLTSDEKFKCRENALAITKLQEALHWLNHRTEDRERRGVEGTHQA